MHACSTIFDSLQPCVLQPQGSSVHGIFQARILEWFAISLSMHLSYPGVKHISPALAGRVFTSEPPRQPLPSLYHCKSPWHREVSSVGLQVQAANCSSKDLPLIATYFRVETAQV